MASTVLDQYINYIVSVKRDNQLRGLAALFQRLQKSMVKVGVTTIFLDRFVQSLTRAWGALNNTLGVVRLGETGQQILRMADFMEIGTDKLQAFNAAMGTLGKDTDFTRDLLQTFNERVSDISSVQGIADDFARIGLSARDFADSEDAIDRFLVFANQLQKVTAKQRMTAVEAILGGDLSVAGQLGSAEDILDLMQQAIDKGQIFSRQQLELASSFQRAFHSVGKTLTALSNNIGSTLMPVLIRVAQLIEFVTGKISGYINKNTERISESVEGVFDNALDKMNKFFKDFNDNVKDLGEPFARLLPGVLMVATGFAVFMSATTLGFVTAIALATLAFALAVDDVMTYLRGGDSTLGNAIERFKAFTQGTSILRSGMKLLTFMWDTLVTQVRESTIFDSLSRLFGTSDKPSDLTKGITLLAQAIGVILVGGLKVAFTYLEFFIHLITIILEGLTLLGNMLIGGVLEGLGLGGEQGYYDAAHANARDIGQMGVNMFGSVAAIAPGARREFHQRVEYNISTTDPTGAMNATPDINNRLTRDSAGPR